MIKRDINGKIISIHGFNRGDYIVFDRSIGGYSDAIFKITDYLEINNISYVEYDDHGTSDINSFFSNGYRRATKQEIKDYNN